jgi:8-oxo-dGTP pyrophosphatase MutT (NUDIX family)
MLNRPTNQPAQRANQPTITDVRRALARPLPGLAAQSRMMPAYHLAELRDRTAPPAPKEAGVLILFYPHAGQLFFPLTRRTDTLENHKGQISLPGGAREGNESLQETALRETCEELGVCRDDWNVFGPLTPLFIPPSGFLINPFVAYSETRPAFEPDVVEVAELIETPLSLLLAPSTVAQETWQIRGAPIEVPFFHIYGHKVWGATAMVLSELAVLLYEKRM